MFRKGMIIVWILILPVIVLTQEIPEKVDMSEPQPLPARIIEKPVKFIRPEGMKLPDTPTQKSMMNRAEMSIFSDDFEGDFPGNSWEAYANISPEPDVETNVNAFWGKTNYRSYSGNNSVWCAKDGPAGVDPAGDYPNNMDAWMIAGPFDLSDALTANLDIWLWLQSEYDSFWGVIYDYVLVGVSIDGGNTFYGVNYGGDSDGWIWRSLDLSNVFYLGSILGEPEVYIALEFYSDYSNTYAGAYIDDVILRKSIAGETPTPTPSPTPTDTPTPSPTPTPTPVGYHSTFTVFNEGTAPLQVTSITKEDGSSWLTVIPPGNYPIKIPVTGSVNIDVYADPEGLGSGIHSDRLLVESNVLAKSPYPGGVDISISKLKLSQEVMRYIIGETDRAPDGSDSNGDGKVDVADMIHLLKSGN